MNRIHRFIRIALMAALTASLPAQAADLTKQEPVTVTLKLGIVEGQHRFTPDSLTLEAGKLYKLRLENTGSQPYYFGSAGLADMVYTRKVVALDAAGKVVAEIYGPIRRIEISAGHTTEWWFLPVRTGVFDDVISTKKTRRRRHARDDRSEVAPRLRALATGFAAVPVTAGSGVQSAALRV